MQCLLPLEEAHTQTVYLANKVKGLEQTTKYSVSETSVNEDLFHASLID